MTPVRQFLVPVLGTVMVIVTLIAQQPSALLAAALIVLTGIIWSAAIRDWKIETRRNAELRERLGLPPK